MLSSKSVINHFPSHFNIVVTKIKEIILITNVWFAVRFITNMAIPEIKQLAIIVHLKNSTFSKQSKKWSSDMLNSIHFFVLLNSFI